MRVLAMATILLLYSNIVPTFAQQTNRPPDISQQPQTVPVEPQRSPQQSEQAREQDRREAEDTQIGRGWRAQRRDEDRSGRTVDEDHRMVGRDWRTRRDDQDMERDRFYRRDRDYYDEDRRPWRRMKVCFEYENGDEYCRYRN
jgi:hypothetical protein